VPSKCRVDFPHPYSHSQSVLVVSALCNTVHTCVQQPSIGSSAFIRGGTQIYFPKIVCSCSCQSISLSHMRVERVACGATHQRLLRTHITAERCGGSIASRAGITGIRQFPSVWGCIPARALQRTDSSASELHVPSPQHRTPI
jgi:hypothetical protein